MRIKKVMTIGGSDSGGGAGIQADIKTFSALNVYGASVITAITAQNFYTVQEIKEVPSEFVIVQIESIMEDESISADYAKTGMLYSAEIIKKVAFQLKKYNLPFVLDPVMKAGTGCSLLEENALNTLIKYLLPLCVTVTPNVEEASVISGMKIKDKGSAKEAAIRISELGSSSVIIKGGHLVEEINKGKATDLIYDGEFKEISSEFVGKEKKHMHGAGCTFSAALAAELAKGENMFNAVSTAKKFVYNAIFGGEESNSCVVTMQNYQLNRDASRYNTLKNVKEAVRLLKKEKGFKNLIPEVGINLGMAIEGASNKNDVAAIDGRIVPTKENVHAGCVEFGASDHIARIILAAMRYDQKKRSAINIRYSKELLKACIRAKLTISSFDREKEESKEEGKTMEWGFVEAIKGAKKNKIKAFPDVIYDLGSIGKEPMIRVFGNTAIEVASKVKKIIEALEDRFSDKSTW